MPPRTLLKRLALLAWRHRREALPAAFVTVALQLLTLAGLGGQGLAIDVVRHWADPSAAPPRWPLDAAPPESWGLTAQVGVVAGFVLLLAIGAGVGRYLNRVLDERFVQACVVDLRTALYARLNRLDFTYFDRHDTGQVINRVTGDTQSVRAFIQGVMIRSAIALVSLVVFVSFMLREHAWLTLAVLAPLPVQVWAMVRFGRRTKPLWITQSKLVDGLVKTLQESIAGVRVVRAFGREGFMQRRFDERSGEARDHRVSIAAHQARAMPVSIAASMVSAGLLLGVGGYLVMLGPVNGGIALGTLWVFRGLLDQLQGQADAIVQIIAGAPESLAGAERVFRMLDEPAPVREATRPHADRAAPIRGKVEFQNVTFAYSGDERDAVLREVSLTVEPGQTIAIVGPTGAGKSTLLAMIPRFHDPIRGRVLIDGVDAREIPLDELRRSVGFVFQEPFLFSNTIGANVALGVPETPEEALWRACDAAGAVEFVRELPRGLQTVVGERGVSLSGGQRQRLTIARALVVEPRILILDDATGAIDPITEAKVLKALDRHMEGRTTFIVAHRLSTLRRADRIVVLDEGRVVDTGTHEELMERPGHYRAAALIQLALKDDDETGEAVARDGAAASGAGRGEGSAP